MDEAQLDALIESLIDQVGEVAEDTEKLTQAESADVFAAVAAHCQERATMIRQEMEVE